MRPLSLRVLLLLVLVLVVVLVVASSFAPPTTPPAARTRDVGLGVAFPFAGAVSAVAATTVGDAAAEAEAEDEVESGSGDEDEEEEEEEGEEDEQQEEEEEVPAPDEEEQPPPDADADDADADVEVEVEPTQSQIDAAFALVNAESLHASVDGALSTILAQVKPDTARVMELTDALPATPASLLAVKRGASFAVAAPTGVVPPALVDAARAVVDENPQFQGKLAVSSSSCFDMDLATDLDGKQPNILVLTSAMDASFLGGGVVDAVQDLARRGVVSPNATTVVPCRVRVLARPVESRLGLPASSLWNKTGVNVTALGKLRSQANVVHDAVRFPHTSLGPAKVIATYAFDASATNLATWEAPKFASYVGVAEKAGAVNAFAITWEADLTCASSGGPTVTSTSYLNEYVLMLDAGQDSVVEAGTKIEAAFASAARVWHVSRMVTPSKPDDVLVVVRSECDVGVVVSFAEEDLGGAIEPFGTRVVRPPVGATLVAREEGYELGEGVVGEMALPSLEAGAGVEGGLTAEFVVKCGGGGRGREEL